MKIVKMAITAALLATLSACGGGGGSASLPITPAESTVVSGMATKGPFKKDSVVKVYAVVNGQKGTVVGEAVIADDSGSYSANLGSYTGPIIVEVSGSYQDEATGNTVPVSPEAPLRAALPAAQGAVSLPVTPLTELAVAKTGGTLTPTAIAAANTMVSQVFNFDIVATMPVAPTAEALSHVTDPHQKEYTVALAAISQMASTAAGATDAEKIKSVLSTLEQGMTSGGMAAETSSAFQSALVTFVTTNPNNATGITDTSAAGGITKMGMTTKSYTLSLSGNTAPAGGIEFDLALPAGVTVDMKSVSSQVMSTSSLVLSGSSTSNYLAARYSMGDVTVGIISSAGIAAGNFATLTCTIPAGSTAPAGSAFGISKLRVMDANGVPIPGTAVTVN